MRRSLSRYRLVRGGFLYWTARITPLLCLAILLGLFIIEIPMVQPAVAATQEPEPAMEIVEVREVQLKPAFDVPLEPALLDHVLVTAEEYDLEPELILAVIRKESNFNVDAIGDNGASFGLMQIQPRWWSGLAADIGCEDFTTDPYQNITLGSAIIRRKLNSGKGVEWAIMAYNGGDPDANAKRKEGRITQHTALVMKYYEEYCNERQN